MKIIVGLGNKGNEYEKTRHNFGFMCLDYLSNKYNFNINKKLKKSLVGECTINKEKVIFVKPETYMNLSGDAVLEVINWYKEDISNVLIIYDDIDIPFESIRYKESGSAGTHNGMRDIINKLKVNNINRIRLGMGNVKHENQDMVSFVLGKFSKEEESKLNNIFDKVNEKILQFLDK